MTAFELAVQEPAVPHTERPELGDFPTPRHMTRAVIGEAGPKVITVLEHKDARALLLVNMGGDIEQQTVSAEHPCRVLDLHAGPGCWASEFARWWVHVLGLPREWLHITAIEINPDRGPDLRKWCDDVYIGDWRELLLVALANQLHTTRGKGFDLIQGNPDFAHILRSGKVWSEKADKGKGGWAHSDFRDAGETLVPTLRKHAPSVLLFHRAAAFEDSPFARDEYRANPPAFEWKCGRVAFSGTVSTDSSAYRATLWLASHEGPCKSYMLPEPESRRWYREGAPKGHHNGAPGSESPEWARANGYPLAPSYES